MQASSSSGATAEISGGLRHVSGENEDAKEYRRWKLWVSTLDKVAAEARGPYVFTLLIGKALGAVEHMDPSVYQCKDGEKADVAEILAATCHMGGEEGRADSASEIKAICRGKRISSQLPSGD